MKTQNKKLAVGLFILLFFALNFALGELLELPKEDLVEKGRFEPQRRWEEFYSLPRRSIDILFLGSSHSYRSFDPDIFDAITGKGTSFNMGSSAQTPITSYFVLKEVLKTQRPKVLIFEVFWQAFENDKQFVNATYNLEYMRSPDVRREFLLHGYAPADWLYFFVPAYRYRMNAADTLKLLMDEPLDYEEDTYEGRGYIENPEIVTKEALRESRMFDGYRFTPENLNEKQLRYFGKILELCRKKGIRLIFVSAPLPELSRAEIKNYGDIHAYFRNIATAGGIPYFDYNLIDARERLFSLTDFKDADHLNKTGAEKISADFARRLKPLL